MLGTTKPVLAGFTKAAAARSGPGGGPVAASPARAGPVGP